MTLVNLFSIIKIWSNNGLNDLSVPCGGILSNLKAGSTVGCNEPNPGSPTPPTSPSTMWV